MAPLFSPWTEHLVEELKRLWAAGYSARDIAHELGGGMTRCAVLGKINRLGLERRKPAQRKDRATPIKRGRPIVRRPVFIAPPPTPEPLPPPTPEPGNPRMRRLQLLALQEQHCRWPIGDPHGHPFYFCAADRDLNLPYCAFHMRKAFAKPRGG